MKICQAIEYALRHFAKHFLPCPAAKLFDFPVYTVQASPFAELHGYGDCASRVIHKRTVIPADMLWCAVFVEIELSYNLLLDVWVWIRCDYLRLTSGAAHRWVKRRKASPWAQRPSFHLWACTSWPHRLLPLLDCPAPQSSFPRSPPSSSHRPDLPHPGFSPSPDSIYPDPATRSYFHSVPWPRRLHLGPSPSAPSLSRKMGRVSPAVAVAPLQMKGPSNSTRRQRSVRWSFRPPPWSSRTLSGRWHRWLHWPNCLHTAAAAVYHFARRSFPVV